MSITREELTDEIVKNARRDRKRLELVADGLARGFQGSSDETDVEDEESNQPDAEVMAGYAEEMSTISEALTRINHELVELVKLEKKSERLQDTDKLPQDELESVLDEIQPEGTVN